MIETRLYDVTQVIMIKKDTRKLTRIATTKYNNEMRRFLKFPDINQDNYLFPEIYTRSLPIWWAIGIEINLLSLFDK